MPIITSEIFRSLDRTITGGSSSGNRMAWRYPIGPSTPNTLSNSGNFVRIYVKGHNTTNYTIDGSSIGVSTANDDFDSTPTRVTWNGGNAGMVITAGTVQRSDWVYFVLNSAVRHLFHMQTVNPSQYWWQATSGTGQYVKEPVSTDDTLTNTVAYTGESYITHLVRIEVANTATYNYLIKNRDRLATKGVSLGA